MPHQQATTMKKKFRHYFKMQQKSTFIHSEV